MKALATVFALALALCGCGPGPKAHQAQVQKSPAQTTLSIQPDISADIGADTSNWHKPQKVSESMRQSASYKFLMSHFGGILVKCDPDFAASLGDDYLWGVMADGNKSNGVALGYGRTFQGAVNAAANSYIPADQVKRLDAEMDQMMKEQKARADAYRKKGCCKEDE